VVSSREEKDASGTLQLLHVVLRPLARQETISYEIA
jgi:hypothetical protein